MSTWFQQSLTPPDALELRLYVGVIPERNHAQVMVELLDPITGILVAQWSAPHGHLDRWQYLLEEAVEKAKEYLGDAIEPF